MSDTSTAFDVRDHVKNAERHNAIIQAGYDTVNRMASLLESITFGELLTEPFKELIPRIIDRVDETAARGLIDDPDTVKALLNRLMECQPDESFQQMATKMCQDDAVLPRDFWSPVWKLWIHHGVKLPEFHRYSERNGNIKQAINSLIEEAGDFNYRSILTTVGTKDLMGVRIAVWQGVDNMVIYLPHNGLCCSCSGGCQCQPAVSTDFCAVLNGQCTTGSSSCGGSSPPF